MGAGQPGDSDARAILGEIADLVTARTPARPDPWAPSEDRPQGGDVERTDVALTANSAGVDPGDVAERANIEQAARARRLPYLATAATAAIGYAAWGCASLAGAIAPESATTVAAVTCAATAAALPVLHAVWRHRIPEAWRRRWWLAGMLAAGWVDVSAASGPASLPMTGVLLLGSVALSARWAAEHEVPNPGQVVLEEPQRALPAPPKPRPVTRVIEPALAVRIEQAWRTRVGAGEAPIAAKSKLHHRTALTNGARWEITLDPDRSVGATTLVGCAAALALALQVSISDLILEVGEREDQAFITVIERNALTNTPTYQGPECRNGVVPIGMEGDGETEAEFIAWEHGQGVRNGLVTGDMGSGKTALLELVGMGLRSTGIWKVWWGDGDPEGSSSNLMMRPGVADWPEAGAEGLLRQLCAFEALVESRGKRKHLYTDHPVTGLPVLRTSDAQMESRELPPCHEFPGYYWMLPEFFTICQDPMLKEHRFVLRLETALRRCRKFGLGAAADTQSANGGDFGNSPTMRSFLNMTNAIFMRTSNPGEEYSVNGLTVSPGLLPRGGGFGLIANRGRVAPMRTFWTPTLHQWVPALPTCREHPDDALAIAAHRPAVEAAGGSMLVQQQAEMELWRTAARAGDLPDQTADTTPAAAGVGVPEPLSGRLFQFPTLIAADGGPVQREVPVVRVELDVSPKGERVLAVMQSRPGPWRSAELIAQTGLSASDVSKSLRELVAAGRAHRPSGVQGIHAAGPGSAVA